MLVGAARALTLEEAVVRAGEVDPTAVVAELEWRKLRLEAAESWSAMTVTPELTLERSWRGNVAADEAGLQVTVGVLDPPLWFEALDHSSQARSARWAADATTLDAQYAAALLYFEALAADAAVETATLTAADAQATLAATRARAAAGIDDPLMSRTAEVHGLETAAALARARAAAKNARTRLSRALEQEVDDLAPAAIPALPEPASRSPWLTSYDALAEAARFEELQAWAELAPSAELRAETQPGAADWRVSLQGTWTFDGIGPFLRARRAALEGRQMRVTRDGLRRDFDLAIATGGEDARAYAQVAEAARAREALAAEALRIGQARLGAGLVDTLDLIQLQQDVWKAREDRVEADLAQAYAVLEARRLAGMAW